LNGVAMLSSDTLKPDDIICRAVTVNYVINVVAVLFVLTLATRFRIQVIDDAAAAGPLARQAR